MPNYNVIFHLNKNHIGDHRMMKETWLAKPSKEAVRKEFKKQNKNQVIIRIVEF
jgi:hypothetical protein